MDDYNPDDFDWLQAATECAEYTYHLNPHLYEITPDQLETRRAIGRKGAKIYREKYPGAIKARNARHRKTKRDDDNYTPDDLALQMKAQKSKCWWCGKKIKGNDYHPDHVIPLARGGSNKPENIVVSCPTCNHKKGAKTPAEFMGRLF